MKGDDIIESATPFATLSTGAHAGAQRAVAARQQVRQTSGHAAFWIIWHACTVLLLLSLLSLMHPTVCEYSTRRYLKGFSGAIVPVASTPIGKVRAILNWMSRGPARKDAGWVAAGPNRNPTETLNYASLLKVCGTATNAFINLADSAGLSARRRLLLFHSHRMTKDVVSEVFLGGRWIIVDPVFRVVLRGPHAKPLTRKELADPAVFSAATREIPNYGPAYNRQRTSHVHLEPVPYVGHFLRTSLNALLPGWNGSPVTSLLLERESLTVLVLSITLLTPSGSAPRRFALLRRGLARNQGYARAEKDPFSLSCFLRRFEQDRFRVLDKQLSISMWN